jgi:ABC-type sugar transport system permease subunit
MYQPQFGLFSSITRALGFGAPLWLQSSKTAMACIVAMDIWKSVGYNMIIFMAGLTNIPASLYEAAEVDGANGRQKFTSLTIPLLQPTTLFIMVVTIIGALQIFTQVHIMTQGGPENSTRVFVQYLRDTSFLNLELGYGAALSFILFLIVLMLTAVQFRLLRTKWEY